MDSDREREGRGEQKTRIFNMENAKMDARMIKCRGAASTPITRTGVCLTRCRRVGEETGLTDLYDRCVDARSRGPSCAT